MLRVSGDFPLGEPPAAVGAFRKLVVVNGCDEDAGWGLLARREAIEDEVARAGGFGGISFEHQVVRPVASLEPRTESCREAGELLAAGERPAGRDEGAVIGERLGPAGAVAGIDGVVVLRVELLNCELIFDAERHGISPGMAAMRIRTLRLPWLAYDMAISTRTLPMRFRAFALLLAGVALLGACDSGKNYDSDKGDDDYDLAAMALGQDDLPSGFQQIPGTEFTGSEWAEVFGSDDPESKQQQLEAQGWLKNYVTESVPPRFGKVLNIRSVSTLYTNEKAAQESTAKFACGLPIDTSKPIDEFIVPKIADQSNGFFVEEAIDEEGTTLMYTTVCFRTGR